jgi:hypothetical protein
MIYPPKIHLLIEDNYYICLKSLGNKVSGLATKNPKLVTCNNCRREIEKMEKKNEDN